MSRFDLVWLAEALRLHDGVAGPHTDAAVIEARSSNGEVAQRLQVWTRRRAATASWAEAHAGLRSRYFWVLAALALLACVSGFGGALAVLGDGSRPVNIVWALGGLLGLNAVALMFWLLGMVLRPPALAWDRSVLGRLWQGLVRGFGRSGSVGVGAAASPEPRTALSRALAQLLMREGGARWWLGVLTHSLWSSALFGALLGLVWALSLRRYDFVWETTLLSPAVFEAWVSGLGRVPAALGWTVPDAALIRDSGTLAVATEAARSVWAGWLLAVVLLYGLVPRVLLLGVCLWRLNAWQARIGVDLQQAYFVALLALLAPQSVRAGVTDAAPTHWPPAPAAMRALSVPSAAEHSGVVLVMGIEVRPAVWQDLAVPNRAWKWGVVDDRAQRQAARAVLSDQSPEALLLVCDVRQSPDRGNVQLIVALAGMAANAAVCLLGVEAEGSRVAVWLETLAASGFVAEGAADAPTAATTAAPYPIFSVADLNSLGAAHAWLEAHGAQEHTA